MKLFKGIKGIIFDMDGLLVDTESLGLEIFKKILAENKINLTTEQISGFIGCGDEEYYQKLGLKKLFQRHNNLYNQKLRQGIKELPGAVELVNKLSKKYPLVLVSGSLKDQIDFILNSLKIQNCFQDIISIEDVKHSKPSSEGFLKGAQALKVKPEECLVFEDSINGINAAKSAGMKCVGVRAGIVGQQKLDQADLIVNSLEEINFYD